MRGKLKVTLLEILILTMGFVIYKYFNKKSIDKYASVNVVSSEIKRSTIVAFGDSITEGIHIDEDKKWTTLLSKELDVDVINSGVAGNSTKNGLKRIKKDVIEKKPNYVLINFGMNDHYFKKQSKEMVSIVSYKKNMTKMIAEIKKVGAIPIIVLPHMIIEGKKGNGNMDDKSSYYYNRHPSKWYDEIGGANKQLKLYNNEARKVAQEYNIKVIDIYKASEKVDLYKILRTEENSGDDDGVHLSEEGMKFYSEIISKEMKQLYSA